MDNRENHFAKDRELARRMGRLGGKALMAHRGREHMRRIGLKGGEAVKAKYGPDYYRKIAQKRKSGGCES